MGVIDAEIKDCEIAIGGDPHDRDTAPARGEMKLPALPPMPKVPAQSSGRLEFAHGSRSRRIRSPHASW
jgi:hypothetical protein